MIVGHGGPGAFSIGNGTPSTGPLPGKAVANEPEDQDIAIDTDVFANVLSNCCTKMYIAACSVAKTEIEDPNTPWKDDGADFMQDLANGAGSGFQITAWTGEIAFSYHSQFRPDGLWAVKGARREVWTGGLKGVRG